MSGDPGNVALWADADVYTGPTSATDPADVDTAFGGDWDLVGLLDGDDGFTQARDEDVNDHFAWGGILVRTSRRNFKETVKFSALEYNDVTRDLIWPDSPPGELVVPHPKRIKIAFETREGDVTHRLISAYQAEVAVDGDINVNETDLSKYQLVATIYPTSGGVIFNEQQSGS